MKCLLNKNSWFFQSISKYSLGIILLIYLAINIHIYKTFWQELIFDRSSINAVHGEVLATEWYLEGVYQNVINGKNPFATTQNLFYPFGTNFVSTESGNALYFLLIRPFLSTHQSLYLISALSIVAANLGMYLLMRLLKVSKPISFFIGLFFGYMTFLQPRMGHLTYFSIYVFPWFYYSSFRLINDKIIWKKIIFAALTGFFLVMSLYHNLYYFVMLILSVGLIAAYLIIKERKILIEAFKKNYLYLAVSLLSSLFALSPWLIVFKQAQQFEILPKADGWSGAIEYSSDLFGYFFPSTYSKYLGKYTDLISLKLEFIRGVFENFSYLGIIIIFCSAIYFYWMIFKKEVDFRKKYSGLLVIILSFWLLTLGPFLHLAGRWCAKPLPGICIAIPMPFTIFHYLPFMNNIRSPGRLTVGLIFFAYILSGLIIDKIFKKRSKLNRYLIIGGLLTIFIIDHQFIYSPATPSELPNKIYEVIQSDQDFSTVYQIPSIMRDGFIYFGDLSSLDFFTAQKKYNKPTLAGYAGRFPGYKTTYYMNDPFLGYFGRLMDVSLSKNPRIDPNDTRDWTKIMLPEAKKSVDFLDIKYVVIDNGKPYSTQAMKDLTNLGFSEQMTEGKYSLWVLENKINDEYLSVDFNQLMHSRHLGIGWMNHDNQTGWADKQNSLLFNVREIRELSLEFEATSFNQNQVAEIFLNQQLVGKISIGTQKEKYNLSLPPVQLGINIIHFIFNQDPRIKFNYVSLDK